jgi:hypothetical protein
VEQQQQKQEEEASSDAAASTRVSFKGLAEVAACVGSSLDSSSSKIWALVAASARCSLLEAA